MTERAKKMHKEDGEPLGDVREPDSEVLSFTPEEGRLLARFFELLHKINKREKVC